MATRGKRGKGARGKDSNKEILILNSEYSSDVQIRNAGTSFYSRRDDFDWWSDLDGQAQKAFDADDKKLSRLKSRMANCSTANACSSISESAEELAMANPLILRKVLDHLSSPSDLLNCRLVATTWNEFATEILLIRQSIAIFVTYSPDSKSYFKSIPNKTEELEDDFASNCFRAELLNLFPLTQLTDLLSTAKNFPCSHFYLSAGDLDGPAMTQFLQIYGSKIKTLKLDLWTDWGAINRTKLSTVRKLLVEQVPNIKSLHILHFPVEYEEYSDIPDIHTDFSFGDLFDEFDLAEEKEKPGKKIILAQLPALEKIIVHIESYHLFHNQDQSGCLTSKRVIQDIMLSTSNLEFRGSDQDTSCVDCLIALLTTKQENMLVRFNAHDLGLAMLERLAEVSTQLKLKGVTLDLQNIVQLLTTSNSSQRNRMARALHTILNNSQTEILTDFGITGPFGFLPGLDLSVYDKVEYLRIDREDYDTELVDNQAFQPENLGDGMNLADIDFLPPNFNLAHSFPNLVSFSMCGWTCPDFLDCNSLPTVKYLTIYPKSSQPVGEFSEASFSKLVPLFPNLISLVMKEIKNFPAMAKHMWKFIKLETLVIGFDVSREAPGNSNRGYAMDAAFTGFSVETCKRLAKSQKFCKWARTAAKILNKRKELTDESKEKVKHEGDEKKDKTVLKLPTWLDKLRVNPSICDLKELKCLNLDLWDVQEALNGSYSILSEVTGLFAFQVMPNIEIQFFPWAEKKDNLKRIHYSLRSITPYIVPMAPLERDNGEEIEP